MATEIIMPKAGMDMQEGQIIKWHKKEGDYVEKGDVLLEIMTDKVNMEVEAETSGYLLKILKNKGEVVPVIATIGYIGEKDEDISQIVGFQSLSKGKKSEAISSDNNMYDVIIIGGGPAGYVSAIKSAQMGGKVALIEKDILGGTCLNRGCIPAKTYLKNAEIIHEIEKAKKRGIIISNPEVNIDMERTVELKNQVVKTLTTGVQGLLKSNGVDIYNGIGRLTKEKKVYINGNKLIEGKKIILAGGSRAARIDISGIESKLVLTSDEILNLKEIPKELVIIGGGVVGIELGSVFSSFGSKVTIIEVMDRIVCNMDEDISTLLEDSLIKKGVKILTSVRLQRITEKNEKLVIEVDKGESMTADKALLSIGRIPDLEGAGDIKFEMEKGRIKVNDYMETNVEGIYAPGDINGKRMLAHAAFKMGEVAAVNAMGGREKINLNCVPSCIYTIPEAASVGLTEEEAKKSYSISVGKFPFVANGRALSSGETSGFVKVIIDKKYGEILGVHIIGPSASEIINEASSLMAMEITAYEASEIVHGHPTFSEALQEACADSLGRAIHLPKRK